VPLVASVDYDLKRIYLDASTVGTSIDTMDVYREVRARRVSTNGDRNYKPMIVGGGNVQKTATTFTPKFVQLLFGCRIVPYDTSHTLTLVRETFTDDNFSAQEVFDLTPLSPTTSVNILVNVPQVEVIDTGGGGSNADVELLLKYHDNQTRFFLGDGVTEVPQASAVRMTIYDDDDTTPLKTIEFRDSSGTPVTLPNATRYVKL